MGNPTSGIKGVVRVAVVVSPKGKVEEVRVIEADHPDLVDLAVSSIHASRFTAGRENGRAIYSQLATRVNVGGNDEYEVAPKVRSQAKPEYPYYLRRAGLSGRVKVEFIVNTEGRVEAAYAVETSHPAFRQAAIDAVERWRFEPGTVEGKPVNVRLDVPMIFSKQPVIPTVHRNSTKDTLVRAEVIVGRRGTVELTRVLEQTAPEYGYAATQALSEWQFEPPRSEGKVVDTRLIIPLVFKGTGG